jgi:glyoxylase-like metal-dependent hydrolase (beta-lactamase superfamily II)
MPLSTRREFVVSAAAASAVMGLGGPLAFIPPANAQKAADAVAKGFHTVKNGAVEITTIYDGLWEKPHDPAFIKNASVEETKSALKAQGLTDAHVPIPFTVTVVKTGGKTVMFDAGTGGQLAPTAGRMADNMKAAGIDPKSISTIVVTHFHPDHIFGLMAKDTNTQVFPDAEIVVPKVELAWWMDPAVFGKLPEARHGLAKRIQATLGQWKNVRPVDGEVEVAPGIRALPAFGHTAGHTTYVVTAGAAPLMVLADLTNIPALFVRNPGWHAQFDADPALAETVRRKLFERAIADKAIVTGYHYGMPGAGSIQKDGAGYAFVPVV